MSNCSDKRLGEKLFAWELGLLNEVETEEFEVHLIECDHCRAKAEIFSSSSKLMRHNQKFREVVDEVNADLIAADKLSDANKKPGSGAGRVTRFVSTFAFAAAILIILIVKPWKIEIEPNLEAFAAQNRMAVMYFENLADEKDSAKIGDIATNLLITDLSESKYLSVLSNQWLYDVLKNRGLEGTKRIDKETALDIARETDARWIIFGSILQLEPQIIITTQLINVENGQVVTSQRINGTEMDDIFSVIDKLTRKIKLDISLPEDASEEIDRAVADVTTHSPQAYKKYIEGLEAWNMFLEREAVDLFLESIEYDSTFAMAYYQLSLISTSPSITDYIRKALSQIDRVSKQEKIYINSRAAFLIDQNPRKSIEILKEGVRKYPNEKYMHYYLGVYTFAIGDSDESIRFVKKALEIDPNFRSGLNQLAYSYQANQDYENAIITMNKYIELVPDEPNPYDSRGDIYYRSANLEKAMESYEMALEIKPDFESSLKKLADLKMVIRQFETAIELYNKLSKSDVYKYKKSAELGLLRINFYKGILKGSLAILDSLIEEKSKLEESQYNLEMIALAYLEKAKIYNEIKDYRTSLGQFELFENYYKRAFPSNQYPMIYFKVQLFCNLGDYNKAEQVIDELKTADSGSSSIVFKRLSAIGLLEYSKGNLDSASRCLRGAFDTSFSFYPKYMQGIIEYEREKIDTAIGDLIFITPINFMNDDNSSIWTIKTYYYLGILLEKKHQYKDAMYYLNEFLGYWKNADIDLPEINDAINRIEKINQELKK